MKSTRTKIVFFLFFLFSIALLNARIANARVVTTSSSFANTNTNDHGAKVASSNSVDFVHVKNAMIDRDDHGLDRAREKREEEEVARTDSSSASASAFSAFVSSIRGFFSSSSDDDEVEFDGVDDAFDKNGNENDLSTTTTTTTTTNALKRIENDKELRERFRKFCERFEKHDLMKNEFANAEEYLKRMTVYAKNVEKAIERQADDARGGGSAVHGETKFFDLTEEEFRENYLGLLSRATTTTTTTFDDGDDDLEDRDAFKEGRVKNLKDHAHGKKFVPPTDEEVHKLPQYYDWRARGAVTPVKDQGQCGSCWTFSTTGAIEGANFIKTGKLVPLSEQQLLDCDVGCDPDIPQACDSGCNGGLPSNAMEYIVEHGGLDTEESYPYKASKDEKCLAKEGKLGATITNFTFVGQNETHMAHALVKYGPLSIGINAAWMQSYVGGVACPWLCNKDALDHGVLIVGYGEQGFAPARLHKEPYWVIKNSWGMGWGEEGYYRICKDKGNCGVNNMVVAALNE